MRHRNDLPVLIERWFTDRFMKHRGVSPNTIASYRDTFRLLFAFAQTRLGRSPSQLMLRDLDAPFIGAFLEDLETKRSASVRTRNLPPHSHPILLPICGVRGAGTERPHSACARHPQQAMRQAAASVPNQARD